MLTRQFRDQFVEAAREAMEEERPGVDLSRQCVYVAQRTIWALEAVGIKAQIQAGTVAFATSAREDWLDALEGYGTSWSDDEPTTWGEAIGLMSEGGKMPPMHCWVAVTQPRLMLIDLQTRYFPRWYEEGVGEKFAGPEIPDYLWWVEGERQPPYLRYVAKKNATLLARILTGEPITEIKVEAIAR